MSSGLTAAPSLLFLCFFSARSAGLMHAGYDSALSGFAVPELDGSAVDNTCRIFFMTTPNTPTITTTTTTTMTPPITEQAVTTMKRPPVQTPPAAGRPNAAASLLHYLLANSRGGFQPIGRLPLRAYGVTSDSDETPPAWTLGSASSEDSSDES